MELIMFTQLPAVKLISYPHIFHPSYFPYQEQNKNFPKGTGSSQLLAVNALSCCLFVSLFQALLAVASQGCCCLAAYLFPRPRPLFFCSSVLSQTRVGSLGRAGFPSQEQWGSESMWMVLVPQLPRQFST